MEVRLADIESGNVSAVALSPELLAGLAKLPEHTERYFVPSTNARLMPVDKLILAHLRTTGIKNANTLMRDAYDDKIERRESITVKTLGDNYLVIDGNSTAVNAIFSDWKLIQVEILEE